MPVKITLSNLVAAKKSLQEKYGPNRKPSTNVVDIKKKPDTSVGNEDK